MVAAAIIGGAVIGAGGAYASGSSASKATGKATDKAIQEQQMILDEQASLSQPYRELGEQASGRLKELLGLTPGSDPTTLLRSTPGYQFTREEGNKGTLNKASAMGMSLSGNTLEALDKFNTGLADQTYQQSVQNLVGATGLGQAAAAGQASNLGVGGGNISNLISGQGNTLAGINSNEIAGITKAVGGGIDNYTMMQTLKGLQGGGSTSPSTYDYNLV